MDRLKKCFPLAFGAKIDVMALVVNLLIHIVVDVVLGFVIGLLAELPVIGIAFGLPDSAVGLYIPVSLVLSILHYRKVVK